MASHKVNMIAETVELMNQLGQFSLASHTLRKEEGSATIELLLQQKLTTYDQ